MTAPRTLHEYIPYLAARLMPVYPHPAHALRTARHLLEHLLQTDATGLVLHHTIELSPRQHDTLEEWIQRIVEDHEPLAYVIGHVTFCGHRIEVGPPLLIPRPETEWWCAQLIEELSATPPGSILDLCTGTGCIALACAAAFPQAHVYGLDIHPAAHRSLEHHAKNLNLPHITAYQGDLWEALPARAPHRTFDLITANPPYIPYRAWEQLEPSVKEWEDPHALHDQIPEGAGIGIVSRIIKDAPTYLNPGGQLWIECDTTQGEWIADYARRCGLEVHSVMHDLAGHPRVLRAQRPYPSS